MTKEEFLKKNPKASVIGGNTVTPKTKEELVARQQQEGKVPQGGIFSRALKNLLPSTAAQFGNLASSIINPVETVKTIGKIGVGLATKALPGEAEKTESVMTADAAIDVFKERYGSWDKIKETFAEDPAGLLLDLSTVIGGGAGIVKGGATLSKAGRVASVAGKVERAASAVDPLTIAGKAAGKVVGKVKPTMNVASKAATERLGVDLTAGMATKSKIVPALEAFSERSIMSGGKMSERVDLAKSQVQIAADSIIKNAGPDTDAITVGKELIKASDNFHDNWVKTKNNLYDEAKLPPGAWVDPTETRSFVNEIMKQRESAAKIIGSASKENPFEAIQSSISGKKVKLTDFRNAIRQLNETIKTSTDPVVTGNKASLKKLVSTMSDEFDSKIKELNPKIAKKIDNANAYYRSGLEVMNSSIGKTIEAYRENPSKIVDALVKKSTSIEDISRISELLGENALPPIRRAVMEDIIETGRKAGGAEGEFKTAGLVSGMNKYGDKMNYIFTPEQVRMIKDLDETIKAVNRTAAGKGLADSVAIATISGKVAAFSTMMLTNPIAALAMLVGDGVASRFIASEIGQKILMTGELSEKIPKLNGKIDMLKATQMMRQVDRVNDEIEQ